MRLFIAVTPPDNVLDEVDGLVGGLRDEGEASEGEGGRAQVRWTRRAQWHITLRFLGEVEEVVAVVEALEDLTSDVRAPVEARLGPSVELLGRSVVCVPVAGLERLAAAVTEATASLGQSPEARPFYGHLTLARLPRRGGVDPERWLGSPFEASWQVTKLEVVRSHRGPDGSRYETLSTLRLG